MLTAQAQGIRGNLKDEVISIPLEGLIELDPQ